MRPNRSKRERINSEAVYDVVRTSGGWAVVRANGGYREDFPTREAALGRACEICRQLAPAKVRLHDDDDPGSAPLEEVVYCHRVGNGGTAVR
jgi:hypothetical protein